MVNSDRFLLPNRFLLNHIIDQLRLIPTPNSSLLFFLYLSIFFFLLILYFGLLSIFYVSFSCSLYYYFLFVCLICIFFFLVLYGSLYLFFFFSLPFFSSFFLFFGFCLLIYFFFLFFAFLLFLSFLLILFTLLYIFIYFDFVKNILSSLYCSPCIFLAFSLIFPSRSFLSLVFFVLNYIII